MRVEPADAPGRSTPLVQLDTADARRHLRDVAQGLGHDLRRRRKAAARSASSPTATCAGRWPRRTSSNCGPRRDDARPVAIPPTTLAAEALAIIEQRKITSIVVIDADRRVEGVVHLHDLWRTRNGADESMDADLPFIAVARWRCWSASPSARRGSATSCATASGSIGAARATRITTCSGSTSWSPTRSTSRSRS